MNYHYNLQFDKLIRMLNLGEMINTPVAIAGGLLHRMYAIETTIGRYAVKALNPQVMNRETAFNNFIKSEKIATIAAKSIPAQPAIQMDDNVIHCVENQFYLVFDWIDGYSLKRHEVNIAHCKEMGNILARLHKIDFSHLQLDADPIINSNETDWNFYLHKGEENKASWVNLLHENINRLFIWSEKAKRASKYLASEQVISHGDLEPKNVMWLQENPVLIDWESAGYRNRMGDLIETAIYWSVNDSGIVYKERFLAFISGYQNEFGALQADWQMILEHGFLGKLEWLEYNLKRSLWIECADEEEQQVGALEVLGTINAIKQYELMIPELVAWIDVRR